MAKNGKSKTKSKSNGGAPTNVTGDLVRGFKTRLDALNKKKATNKGDISALYADMVSRGVNKDAFKLCIKLAGFEPNKRADVLRGIDQYRGDMKLDDQPDLFEEAGNVTALKAGNGARPNDGSGGHPTA